MTRQEFASVNLYNGGNVKTIIQLFQQHPYYSTAILTYLSTTGVSAFINALPAPTATSSQGYIFFFKLVVGLVAGNPSRARNNAVESSPNWQAAVQKHIDTLNLSPKP